MFTMGMVGVRATSDRLSPRALASGLCFLLGAGILLLVPGGAWATTITYPNVPGTEVSFQNIRESSATDPLPLFGAPTGNGNQLLFSPQGFASSSSNLSADTTDGQLSLNIVVAPAKSKSISHVRINEMGDYSLMAAQTGLIAKASVATPVFIRVNNDLNLTFSTNMIFSPNGGVYALPAHVATGTVWNGSLDIDIGSYLLSRGYAGPATEVYLTVDDILSTSSTPGTSASIAKKLFGMDVTVITVPEPGTLVLLGCCGLCLAFLRSRYSSRSRRCPGRGGDAE